jgi:Zn-dependent protease with chaperone function
MPRFLTALAAVVLLGTLVYGEQRSRDPKKEQVICEKLAAVAPGALENFQRATVAMDNRDYSQAAQLYREVVKQAPQFSPALRRLGFSLAGLGQTDEAIALGENAVNIERSPENLASLAELLAHPAENKEGTPEQKEWALTLAKEANERDQSSDDPSYAMLMAQIALDLKREAEFRQATAILVQKYPDQVATHYFNGIRLAMDGSWIAAEDEIKKAERLGLPAQMAHALLASGIHTRATAWRWAYYGLYLLAAWVCGLFILFVAGKVFSKLTLRFIERADLNNSVSGAETVLRRYYRRLINIAGTYYYVSIPFVIFLVLAVAGSIVYGFLVLGHIPIKLVFIIVIGAIVTVYKMVHSLFVRVNAGEPGRSLRPEEAPGLWRLTREVAEKLGTRPLDEIRVAPGTEMAVYERGSYRDRRRDVGRRTLVMGLGLLADFDQNPFRAVLAHEYGHLSHRDTAGGDVALRVNQDMIKFAYAMAHAGQAVWWNIGFQFLRLYHFLFRRISHGATRLQEVLADRSAARLYGAQPFEEGLRHVVRRQIEFNHFARKEIEEALKSGRALQNVYALEMQSEKTLDEAIDHAINRQTSEDDTHPSPVDRFRLVSRVICQNAPAPSGPMWDLFADREAITKEMSSQIEMMVKAATA